MRISDWSSDVCSSDLFSPSKGQRGISTLPLAFRHDCIGKGIERTRNGDARSQALPDTTEPLELLFEAAVGHSRPTSSSWPVAARMPTGGRMRIAACLVHFLIIVRWYGCRSHLLPL